MGGGGRSLHHRVLEEFDFETSNARFDKEKVLEEVEAGGGGEDFSRDDLLRPAYDKSSSFFDSISCDALERVKGTKEDNRYGGSGGRPNRSAMADQRRIDAETFGQTSIDKGRQRNIRGRRFTPQGSERIGGERIGGGGGPAIIPERTSGGGGGGSQGVAGGVSAGYPTRQSQQQQQLQQQPTKVFRPVASPHRTDGEKNMQRSMAAPSAS